MRSGERDRVARGADAAAYAAWYHTARGRWIGEIEFRLLQRLLRPKRGESLLDVGCGSGYFARRFAAEVGLRVVGIDPDASAIEFARSHAAANERYDLGRAEALPFPDRGFDYTIAVTSLCFIAEQQPALREMLRVTRKRFAVGWLNRRSLLYLQKGRRGGTGAYRGAHWDTAEGIRFLFAGLPAANLAVRTAVVLPTGGALARAIESLAGTRLPFGGLIVASGDVVG